MFRAGVILRMADKKVVDVIKLISLVTQSQRNPIAPFTRYNLLSNRLSNWLIVYTNIQPVVKPV